MVAVYVSRGIRWILDTEWQSEHPATMEHIRRVGEYEFVREVIGGDLLEEARREREAGGK